MVEESYIFQVFESTLDKPGERPWIHCGCAGQAAITGHSM
jgi:hypothetical protein